ncbi:SDR family NAD(P)-dependent oxidoreductase [Bythopirellula polymerisocia]|uniref:Putative oxidoreductase n=1 Tax=Bythopirellula polymerisocia TaxID=2528003 RepID=A0A5C6CKK8_9BACT|nr:SDR family NAD(P)-dependent oxidoreductase [Bythopirellula polymerisocia]TWU23831.1 putative oxidoreductase [Bythopirellula polymerisocia]
MSYSWQNKICLVTGASSGLGLAIARSLASHGANVLLNARTRATLEQAADLLSATGGSVVALPGDVTSQADVESLAREVEQRFGGLDLLCNCAGRSTRGEVLDTTTANFQELWEVNFLSVVRMTRAFAPMLIERSGHLVNIGSLAGKVAPRYLGAYPASKFALSAYSQQLRLELGPAGLHVLLVCPGPIKRDDAGERYAEKSVGIPDDAQQPGAGAKLRGIDPDWLAERILTACEGRHSELVVPWKVRWLLALAQLSPSWGDWLLKKATSG